VVNKILKIVFSFPAIVALLFILFLNFKIYYTPETTVVASDTIRVDLLKELRGLKGALRENADVKMQRLYPEGYIFMNALYGLAWCNFMTDLSDDSDYFKEGRAELQKTWNKIDSDRGRSTFNKELPLSYGAFYSGWSTYFLGRKLSLEHPSERKEAEVTYFKHQCDSIASAVNERIYPPSYYGAAWPADAVLCVAALSWHDKLFEPRYADVRKAWLDKVKNNLDAHGLIPHAASPLNGKSVESARGSSQSLMLIFLREIDEPFARQQFSIFQTTFADSRLGLKGIREYPKGEMGLGDVDSGPVILQMGAAASLVGMQTLYAFGDRENGIAIRNGIEGFAFPWESADQKVYLFGMLPVADAFIAWGHSAEHGLHEPTPSFVIFHLISTAICLALGAFIWVLLRPKRPTSDVLHVPW
jgi:hypothetical protein